MVVARVWVREASGTAVLVADGILVDRGIGLGCAVVGGGDAITGFTAIVAVPVIPSTVWVFIYTETQDKGKKMKEKEYYESNIPICSFSCATEIRGLSQHYTNPFVIC